MNKTKQNKNGQKIVEKERGEMKKTFINNRRMYVVRVL